MTRITVRTAELKDEQAVMALRQQWISEEITHGYTQTDPDEFSKRLGPYFLVAESDGDIIGFAWGSVHTNTEFCVFEKGERYFEIDDIYVLPEFRDRSIGSQLLTELEKTARSEDVKRFLIYSSTKDINRILKFYKKHDFKSWYIQMFK